MTDLKVIPLVTGTRLYELDDNPIFAGQTYVQPEGHFYYLWTIGKKQYKTKHYISNF